MTLSENLEYNSSRETVTLHDHSKLEAHTDKGSERYRASVERVVTCGQVARDLVRDSERVRDSARCGAPAACDRELADSESTARCRYLRSLAARPARNRPELSLRSATIFRALNTFGKVLYYYQFFYLYPDF